MSDNAELSRREAALKGEIATLKMNLAQRQKQLDQAMHAISLYRLTLRWVAEDLEVGCMQGTTVAAAQSDLKSYLGGLPEIEQ